MTTTICSQAPLNDVEGEGNPQVFDEGVPSGLHQSSCQVKPQSHLTFNFHQPDQDWQDLANTAFDPEFTLHVQQRS